MLVIIVAELHVAQAAYNGCGALRFEGGTKRDSLAASEWMYKLNDAGVRLMRVTKLFELPGVRCVGALAVTKAAEALRIASLRDDVSRDLAALSLIPREDQPDRVTPMPPQRSSAARVDRVALDWRAWAKVCGLNSSSLQMLAIAVFGRNVSVSFGDVRIFVRYLRCWIEAVVPAISRTALQRNDRSKRDETLALITRDDIRHGCVVSAVF